MSRMINLLIRVGGLTAILFLLIGCASLGVLGTNPPSEPFKAVQVPKDKALVYIYRVERYAGSANMVDMKENGKPIGRFRNGSYHALLLDPGNHVFSESISAHTLFLVAQIESQARGENNLGGLMVEAGKTYYLELIVTGMSPELAEVSDATGATEIKSLQLFPSDSGPG